MSYDGGGGREAGKRVRGCPNAEVSYVLPFFTIDRPPVQNWFDGILLGLVLLCLWTGWPRHRHTGCLTYRYVESEALEFLRQKRGRTEGPEAVCTFAKKLHEEFGGRSM
jgi:hypothetical protein